MPKEEKREARNPRASLVEALQSLVADMTKASTDSEAEEGLKRLKEIRVNFLERGGGELQSARKQAEALIAWVEQRLEQLRQQLARKRRLMEGQAMEKIAREREAEGPSLLPTELIDAVVHSTDAKDPTELKSSAPQPEPVKPDSAARPAETKAPAKKPEKKPERKADIAEAAKPAGEANKASEWTRYELLAAHLAASIREDRDFFEKLRKRAKAKGPRQKAPEDNGKAETHFRTVHDLGKRLVNMEMHVKAMAAGADGTEKLQPLLKTAARELKGFYRDLKAAKQKLPEMAGEYERLFGGWAEQLSAIKPEKGGAILEKCRAGQQPQKEAREAAEDAPQLVLKRNEWDQ